MHDGGGGSEGTIHGPNMPLLPHVRVPCLPFRKHVATVPGVQKACACGAKPTIVAANVAANTTDDLTMILLARASRPDCQPRMNEPDRARTSSDRASGQYSSRTRWAWCFFLLIDIFFFLCFMIYVDSSIMFV